VRPPGQRLDAGHRAQRGAGLADRHDRLVGDGDLALGQRAAQVGDQRQPVLGLLAGLLVEQRPGALAAVLGLVHRDVGIAQQPLGRAGRGRAGRQHDADAAPDRALPAVEQHRAAQRLEQPVRHRGGLLLVAHRAAEHRELVAAEAGHQVPFADRALEPLADLHEQAVTRVVAERVVDQLEVVEVEEQHGERLLAAGEVRGDLLQQLSAVGQAGQSVVQGPVRQLALPGEPVGDVLEGAEKAGVAARAAHRHDAGVHLALRAVGAGQAQRQLDALAHEHPTEGGQGRLEVVRVQVRHPLGAEQLCLGQAVHRAVAVVDVAQAQAAVGGEDADRRLVGQGLEPLVGRLQLLGDLVHLGGRGQAQDPAGVLGLADGDAGGLELQPGAVAALQHDAAAGGADRVDQAGAPVPAGARVGRERAVLQVGERDAGELLLGVAEELRAGPVDPADEQRAVPLSEHDERLGVVAGERGENGRLHALERAGPVRRGAPAPGPRYGRPAPIHHHVELPSWACRAQRRPAAAQSLRRAGTRNEHSSG
jgi:hypothetical protein